MDLVQRLKDTRLLARHSLFRQLRLPQSPKPELEFQMDQIPPPAHPPAMGPAMGAEVHQVFQEAQ